MAEHHVNSTETQTLRGDLDCCARCTQRHRESKEQISEGSGLGAGRGALETVDTSVSMNLSNFKFNPNADDAWLAFARGLLCSLLRLLIVSISHQEFEYVLHCSTP